MRDLFFPIPWNYNVVIGDGTTPTTLTADYLYKIMTGASLTIQKNATVNLSGSAIVYSAFDNSELTYGGNGKGYPQKEAAKFTLNGTLNVTGTFGGKVVSTENGAVLSFGSKAKSSASSKESKKVNTRSIFGKTLVTSVDHLTITESSLLHNNDGSTISGESGKTYTYNGSSWTVG